MRINARSEPAQAGRGHVIKVHHASIPQEIVVEDLQDHSINLVQSPVMGAAVWQGSAIRERVWTPGTVTFLPAGSELAVQARRQHEVTMLMVKPAVLKRAIEGQVDSGRVDLQFRDITSPLVTRLAQSTALIWNDPETRNWPLLAESATLALAAAAMKAISPAADAVLSRVRPGLSRERKARVLQYIEDNIGRQITVAELAGVAALSPFHFSRSFKAEMGLSPLRYLAHRRVEEAQRMMRSGELSLSQVAIACGYCSQSHMSTVFKAVLGVTPLEFRRRALV